MRRPPDLAWHVVCVLDAYGRRCEVDARRGRERVAASRLVWTAPLDRRCAPASHPPTSGRHQAAKEPDMADKPVIVVTGTRGNLGGKIAAALHGRYSLRCLDIRGGEDVFAADLGSYDAAWARHFRGAQVVLHFAGAPL